MASRGRGGGDRGRGGGGRGGASDRGGGGAGRGGYSDRGGRGGYSDRGRGGHSDRGGGSDRGRGGSVARGGRSFLPLSDGQLLANYSSVELTKDIRYFMYGIDWSTESRSVKRRLYQPLMQTALPDQSLLRLCMFDGASLYAAVALPFTLGRVHQIEHKGRTYAVTIVSEKELVMQDTSSPDTQSIVSAFNNILKKAIATSPEFVQIGRRFYSNNALELPDKVAREIRVLPGYQTEVVWKKIGGNASIVVNIDPMSKVMSLKTVLSLIKDHLAASGNTTQNHRNIRKELVNSIVYTRYNNMCYTIENVDFTKSPKDTFPFAATRGDTPKPISFIDYYKKMKGEHISDPNQPLLKTSGRGNLVIYLVPELCLLSEISNTSKRELPKVCSVHPADREKRISELVNILSNGKSKEVLESFNLKIKTGLNLVKARQLATPKLTMAGAGEFDGTGNWSAKTSNLKFKATNKKPLDFYIVFSERDATFAKSTFDEVKKVIDATASPYNILPKPIKFSNPNAIMPELNKKLSGANPANTFVLFFLPFNSDLYGAVKQYTISQGIMSQCVKSNKEPLKPAIIPKIAHQVINKFGILSWWTKIETCAPSLVSKPLLLVGLDVYHAKMKFEDGKNIYTQRRSIGGFVAVAIDSNGYRFCCEAIPVEARRELICQNIDNSSAGTSTSAESEEGTIKTELEAPEITDNNRLHSFLVKTQEKLKMKPHTVIMYRDGVAESQLEAVKQTEVRQVRTACPNSSIVYTVVQKRIHTRFLMKTAGGDVKNPAPGVVVDNDLTSLDYNDFYLIPTECTLSTVKPVRYVVLENTAKTLPKSELQQLTFNLCHCYPNWTGSVKLPLPTQLAHKLAYLIGESKIKEPQLHPNLFSSCFYL
eukprot:TRINITY_DN10151_c0_g1_i1.p1 TRINITY_DN10151_c0_g1~~TRINITY_DN10151_c0_g1_i1.p1  ORF type:complete len:879 (-),score=153.97 TRINITY_DN10151_c0_g1_i1:47-2683(-)